MMAKERISQDAIKQDKNIVDMILEPTNCEVIEVAMRAADRWEQHCLEAEVDELATCPLPAP